MPGDDADGFHRADEVVDLLGAEEVFLNLVGHHAVAGFLDRKACKGLGLRRGGGSHRVHYRVDFFLAEFGELEPRLLGAPGERAGFGDRR